MPWDPKPVAICPRCHCAVDALPITWRMREVLERILAQKTTLQISQDLNICVKTVETHRAKLFNAAGVRTVVGLVKWALEQGFEYAQVER